MNKNISYSALAVKLRKESMEDDIFYQISPYDEYLVQKDPEHTCRNASIAERMLYNVKDTNSFIAGYLAGYEEGSDQYNSCESAPDIDSDNYAELIKLALKTIKEKV